jgi:transposase
VEHIGIDVHKKESQVCIITEQGEVIEARIRTQREKFGELLGGRPRARILIEASTESEWVARCIEALGHEVIIADPNFSPMYATRSRKVKTDKRDARALADACRLGAYRKAHRTSDEMRHLRAQLAVRESLVRSRAKFISLTRALLRREGIGVPTGTSEHFPTRLSSVEVPKHLKAEVAPLVSMMKSLNKQIEKLDAALEKTAKQNARAALLTSVPNVGPVTACAVAAALDTPERFDNGHQVAAYFGLVPSEMSSGEQQRKGHITKTGDSRARYLLVQVAISMLRMRSPSTAHLREWAERIAARRGKKIAIVALARKLAGVLFAMLRDGAVYQSKIPTLNAEAA